jgi:hypothetical protein
VHTQEAEAVVRAAAAARGQDRLPVGLRVRPAAAAAATRTVRRTVLHCGRQLPVIADLPTARTGPGAATTCSTISANYHYYNN